MRLFSLILLFILFSTQGTLSSDALSLIAPCQSSCASERVRIVIPMRTGKYEWDDIYTAQWSPDGHYLATANPGGAIRLWSQTGDLLHTFPGHDDTAQGLAWSPDGRFIASGGADKFVRIWDINTKQLVRELEAAIDGTHGLDWQPTGKYLIGIGFSTYLVWDTTTWESPLIWSTASFPDLEWRPDSSDFAYVGGGLIGVSSIKNEQIQRSGVVFEYDIGMPYGINWNRAGSQFVTAGGYEGSVRLWDAATGKQIRLLLQTDEVVNDAVFSNIEGTEVTAITKEGSIYLLDASTGTIKDMLAQENSLFAIDWNPEYDLFAITSSTQPILNPDASTDPQTFAILEITSDPLSR